MLFRRRTPALEAFDVAVARPDDPEAAARALRRAGVDARVVTRAGQEPLVKVRHEDLPRLQQALERTRR